MIIFICFYLLLRVLKYICIIYTTSSSIHSDTIYKSERSIKNNKGNDIDNKVSKKGDDEANNEEESFEIEEEIADIKRLLKLAKKARSLDGKLPYSQKEKNSHLNDLRKEPHVKEFFEDKTPNIEDLVELEDALWDAKYEKDKELEQAKKYSNTESSSSSSNDQSNSNSCESESNLNKWDNNLNKEHSDNYSDYKSANSLLDYLIDFINRLLN